MSTHPLCHWIPYRLQPKDGLVNWLCTEGQRFDAPFFEETIARCLSHPHNSGRFKTRTTLANLPTLAQTVPALEPSAFIFHVSRCGSTLLSQLLSLSERHIVLSEVPLLDEVLRLSERSAAWPSAFCDNLFRAVIQLLGHRRTGVETHLFVKVDSWHVFFYETIRRIYPSVPIILLYRSPNEVVASHQKRPGIQAVPGLLPAHWFGLKPADAVQMTREPYTAQVLSSYLSRFRAITKTDRNAFLLPYQPNGMAMMQQLTRQLDLSLNTKEWEAIAKRSPFHAKYPDKPFTEELPFRAIPDYLQPAMHHFDQLNTITLTVHS